MALTQTVLCTVVGLQTHPVAAIAPTTTGQLLTWNGAAWQPDGNAAITGNLNVSATVTAQTVTQTSDPRLKKDIQKIPGALALVMAIPPKTYRFKTEPNDGPLHWGFLTTDVQEVMGKGFAGVITGDDPDHTQTLAYTEMIAILWRAVQELSDEVAELHDARRRSAQSN
jgi:Chaperone of endosialidase